MSLDITRLSHQTALATAMSGRSAVQEFFEQQEKLRKQLLAPSHALEAIERLSQKGRILHDYGALFSPPMAFGVNQIVERVINVGHVGNLLSQSSAASRMFEENRRIREQVLRLADPFRDMRKRLRLDQVGQVEDAVAHARQVLESLPDLPEGEQGTDWQALEDHFQGVHAAIEHLPLTGATRRQLRATGVSRTQWIVGFFSVLGVIIAWLAYMETIEQGEFSREQASLEQARSQLADEEERVFRQSLLAALDALAQHSPSQHDVYVIGLRAVPVKSAISGGMLLDTAYPNQVVSSTGKGGRWIKIRYRNHLEEREVEGWVLKHYLVRQQGAMGSESED